MKKIKETNKMTLYVLLVLILYSILIVLNLVFNKNKVEYSFTNFEYKKTNILEENEKYKIDVNYPRFKESKISSIITNYLYEYISDFKSNSKESETNQNLSIEYKLNNIDNYINIFFTINNSLDSKTEYKSILIDKKEKKEIFIDTLYGENILDEIKEMIDKKYPEFIFNSIENLTLKDFNYEITEDYINIYINRKYINNEISYDLFVTKILNQDYVMPVNSTENKKYIAFTFDDGPSDYTKELVDAFVLNNSKATFFMLGNRMKILSDTVKYVSDNNMEIGSHSYSHKYLTKISNDEILEEINSVTILYNEITGKNIELLRPPYGSIDENLKSISMFPLITWSIDPYDWLHKDSEFIKEHILSHAYDGAIIIMHDLYPTSVEAVKMLIPMLKEQGYELVTVSELAKVKNKTLNPGEVIREIK